MAESREDEIIKTITRIRANNNKLWMDLLRLALKSDPKKAGKILKGITNNDREVSRWISRLS